MSYTRARSSVAEQLPLKQRVDGSNPSGLTKIRLKCRLFVSLVLDLTPLVRLARWSNQIAIRLNKPMVQCLVRKRESRSEAKIQLRWTSGLTDNN